MHVVHARRDGSGNFRQGCIEFIADLFLFQLRHIEQGRESLKLELDVGDSKNLYDFVLNKS